MPSALLFQNAPVIDGTGAAAIARVLHLQHARRVDMRGLTLMPGLIDAHCHLSLDDAASNPEIFHQRRNAWSALVAAYNARKLLRASMKADLLVVDGDPSQNVGLLGEPGRIREVFVEGRSMDISPLPERRPLAGWRMPSMGRQLTRDFAINGSDAADADGPAIEEP